MNAPVPPRFVPTLTEIVLPESLAGSAPAASPAPWVTQPAEMESRIVLRVLQRLDLDMDRRLREVVGQLILEHTQSLVPRLREEIEAAVRQSVSQAIAQENPQYQEKNI